MHDLILFCQSPEPLEALVISARVWGLCDRDIEALLGEALGPDPALSKSTASRICARLTKTSIRS